jgi:hypothetical protein
MRYLLGLVAPALVFVMLHLILGHLVRTVVHQNLMELLLLAAAAVVFIAQYLAPEVMAVRVAAAVRVTLRQLIRVD